MKASLVLATVLLLFLSLSQGYRETDKDFRNGDEN